jgi:hypothetical protein
MILGHAAGDIFNALRIADRGSTVFLDYEGHKRLV